MLTIIIRLLLLCMLYCLFLYDLLLNIFSTFQLFPVHFYYVILLINCSLIHFHISFASNLNMSAFFSYFSPILWDIFGFVAYIRNPPSNSLIIFYVTRNSPRIHTSLTTLVLAVVYLGLVIVIVYSQRTLLKERWHKSFLILLLVFRWSYYFFKA